MLSNPFCRGNTYKTQLLKPRFFEDHFDSNIVYRIVLKQFNNAVRQNLFHIHTKSPFCTNAPPIKPVQAVICRKSQIIILIQWLFLRDFETLRS